MNYINWLPIHPSWCFLRGIQFVWSLAYWSGIKSHKRQLLLQTWKFVILIVKSSTWTGNQLLKQFSLKWDTIFQFVTFFWFISPALSDLCSMQVHKMMNNYLTTNIVMCTSLGNIMQGLRNILSFKMKNPCQTWCNYIAVIYKLINPERKASWLWFVTFFIHLFLQLAKKSIKSNK